MKIYFLYMACNVSMPALGQAGEIHASDLAELKQSGARRAGPLWGTMAGEIGSVSRVFAK